MATTTTTTSTNIKPIETAARQSAMPRDFGHGHYSSIGHGHGVVASMRLPAAAEAGPKLATIKLTVDEMAACPVKVSLQARPKPISIFPPRPGQPCSTTAAQRLAAFRRGAELHDARRAVGGPLFVS